MTPKTPSELKEQIEAQNEPPAAEGTELTAEGLEIPTPTRGQFFSDLEKVSRPSKD
jgi:hypothetical protein